MAADEPPDILAGIQRLYCCCIPSGFKALEFWILSLSLTASGLVGSTIFDPKTLIVNATTHATIEDQFRNGEYDVHEMFNRSYVIDSDYETMFFTNVLAGAFL